MLAYAIVFIDIVRVLWKWFMRSCFWKFNWNDRHQYIKEPKYKKKKFNCFPFKMIDSELLGGTTMVLFTFEFLVIAIFTINPTERIIRKSARLSHSRTNTGKLKLHGKYTYVYVVQIWCMYTYTIVYRQVLRTDGNVSIQHINVLQERTVVGRKHDFHICSRSPSPMRYKVHLTSRRRSRTFCTRTSRNEDHNEIYAYIVL